MAILSSVFSSILPKSVAVIALATMTMSAHAGFFDSISEVQNAISSVGRTADSISSSKRSVDNLGNDVGVNNQSAQNTNTSLVSGDVLLGKLQNTSLYSQANGSSSTIAVLSRYDTIVYMGVEQNGYYFVHSDKGQGWVAKPLVSAQ